MSAKIEIILLLVSFIVLLYLVLKHMQIIDRTKPKDVQAYLDIKQKIMKIKE